MIAIVLNHDIDDDPYKASAIEKGCNVLEKIGEQLNEHIFITTSGKKRFSFIGLDLDVEFAMIYHTANLSNENKADIACCLHDMLRLKKSSYKGQLPEIHIVFSKVHPSDYFSFNVQ